MINESLQLDGANISVIEENPWLNLNVPYTVAEVLVAVAAIIGNLLVIVVYLKDRRLRRRTKYYIISLAIADLLVGIFGIPFAILASVGLPRNFYLCLFNMSLLVVLCTISIFCLVAVSVDRYWAILYPMSYSRNVRSKTAIEIIIACWLAGALVGFLPLFGWNEGGSIDRKCFFVEVMNYDYLVFLYFATIIAPAILLAAFYAHIYRVVLQQVRQMVMFSPGCSAPIKTSGGMLKVLGAAQKREVKATQNLSIIVLFFIICWFPLYTINFVKAFCRDCNVSPFLTNSCIILSHLNSSFNPFLYAYHLKDFRVALHNLIFGNNVLPARHPKSPFLDLKRQRSKVGSQTNESLQDASIYLFNNRTRSEDRCNLQNHLWPLREYGGRGTLPEQFLPLNNVLLCMRQMGNGTVLPCRNRVLDAAPMGMCSPMQSEPRNRSQSLFTVQTNDSPKKTLKIKSFCPKRSSKRLGWMPRSCEDLRLAKSN